MELSPVELKVVASFVLVLLALLMTGYGKRLGQWEPGFDNWALAIVLAAVLWIPQDYRDLGITGLAFLLGMLGDIVWAFAAAGITFLISQVVPGGATVVLLVLSAGLAYWICRDERVKLRDLDNAKMLTPGEQGQQVVAVIGRAREANVKRPDTDEDVVAWWAQVTVGEETNTEASSTDLVKVTTDDGIALVDLSTINFEARELSSKTHEGDDALPLAKKLGVEIEDESASISITISSLAADKPLFVQGVPAWEADRGQGGYRHTPYVPVFRDSEKHPLRVGVGTLEQVRNRVRYAMIMGAVWTAPCVGIAAVQIAISF